MDNCTVNGCDVAIAYRKAELCRRHYKRFVRTGSPTGGGRDRYRGDSLREYLEHHGWNEVQRVDGMTECWEWAGLRDPNGYGRASGKRWGTDLAHRLAYIASHGSISPKDYVCHRCDNPPCLNPQHMFIGDQTANMGDAVQKKRMAWGEKHWIHKLTEDQVRAIRAERETGVTYTEIAKKYPVQDRAIRDICVRKTWKHLD